MLRSSDCVADALKTSSNSFKFRALMRSHKHTRVDHHHSTSQQLGPYKACVTPIQQSSFKLKMRFVAANMCKLSQELMHLATPPLEYQTMEISSVCDVGSPQQSRAWEKLYRPNLPCSQTSMEIMMVRSIC